MLYTFSHIGSAVCFTLLYRDEPRIRDMKKMSALLVFTWMHRYGGSRQSA